MRSPGHSEACSAYNDVDLVMLTINGMEAVAIDGFDFFKNRLNILLDERFQVTVTRCQASKPLCQDIYALDKSTYRPEDKPYLQPGAHFGISLSVSLASFPSLRVISPLIYFSASREASLSL